MSYWIYQFIVCGENVTGNEHYLFTIKDEDTCLLVSDTGGEREDLTEGSNTLITILSRLVERVVSGIAFNLMHVF